MTIKKGVEIIICTPGRLIDLLGFNILKKYQNNFYFLYFQNKNNYFIKFKLFQKFNY
jgi:hypothetical protein